MAVEKAPEVLQYCNMSKGLWSRVEISGLHCANIHVVVSGLSFNKTDLPHIWNMVQTG